MNIYTSAKKPTGFYVYAYLRKDGTPYYIGKGSGKRAWSKHHSVPVPNSKTKIVIAEENLTELGSLALERRMIRWYGRKDNATGILRNRTDGGDGANGGICSVETRKKLSEASKGCKGRKGHKHLEETKKKLSEAAKGQFFSAETRKKMSESAKGRIRSEETRNKLSEALKGRICSEEHKLKMSEVKSKTWTLIDPNGNILTIKNLAKFCRENNLGQASMCCVAKGERRSYKGWMKF